MKPFHVLTATALALASLAASAQEINFGIIATDSASVERERWEPLFRDMEKKTGLTIKAFYAPDYAGVVEAMRFNKVQVAWYGNKAAIDAVCEGVANCKLPGVVPLQSTAASAEK